MNVAVAKIHELTSEISNFNTNNDDDRWCLKESLNILLKVTEPIMPHLAEECWSQIGNSKSIIEENWPKIELKLLTENECTLVIQINGKKRADIKVEVGSNEDTVYEKAINLQNIKNYIQNENLIKKKIFIQDRVLNIVI